MARALLFWKRIFRYGGTDVEGGETTLARGSKCVIVIGQDWLCKCPGNRLNSSRVRTKGDGFFRI
jgi:hypothetical protein